jgi:TRAP-type C4-dicarboxylate transport system permease small subunit
VSVDVVYRWSSPAMRRVLDAVVSIAALSLVFIIIYWGFQYAQRGMVQTVIGLEGISMLWAYLAMPIGGLFCVIAIIGNYLDPKREELETAQ